MTADVTGTNISAGTTPINFGAEEFDTDGFHSTVSNTSRITIPSAVNNKYGIFTATTTLTGVSGASDLYMIPRIFKNGTTYTAAIWGSGQGVASGTSYMSIWTPPVLLTTNDFWESTPQTQDTSVNIIAASTSFGLYVIG